MTTQVHRFHDVVAAFMDSGKTVYLSPGQARDFGKALIEAANDIDAVQFVNSHLGTFEGRTLTDTD